jgi:serine/threonine-protein kinase
VKRSEFEIIELLSESLTTQVYKARQPALGRIVLLKTIRKHLATNIELVRRFEREAKACAMLKSEFIVQVYALTEFDGVPAIVIEYVEGESLEQLLSREGPRDEKFAVMIAAGVLRALVVAHAAGVIHRDIKPGNILLPKEGGVKLTDFGLASIAAAPSLTVEGSMMGTPAYMSPEQASSAPLGPATDFFSLGTTLVESVTGRRLFDGASYAECISKILNFRLERLDELADEISPEFLAFLKRLMHPSAGGRFSSAREALEELVKFVDDPSVRFVATVRRRRWIGPAAAVVLLGLAAVFVVEWSGPKKMTEVRLEPVEERDIIPRADSLSGDILTPDRKILEKPSSAIHESEPRIEREAEPTAALSETVAPDSGYLFVSCTPWAKVYLDDEYIGTTPIAGTIRVKAGIHRVTFSNPSFPPLVKTVVVRANEQANVDANFMENVGYLFVSITPWAEVYVDDQYRDTTPLSQPLLVTAGTRRLSFRNPAFDEHVTTATIAPRETLRIHYSFSARKN